MAKNLREVDLFIPCFVDQIYPQTAWNTVKLLEKCGLQVRYPQGQTCCGQPAWNAGHTKQCRPVAEKFMAEFSGERAIVTPSASCAGMVRNTYGQIFHNSSRHLQTRTLGARTHELSEYLVDVLKKVDFGAEFHGKASYHDSCSALRECGIKTQPRELLKHVKGLQLLEMADTTTCCGFGGTFAVKFESISVAMAEQKVEHAINAGAEYIISTDVSCLMHMDGYIAKKNLPIKTMHIADVLTQGW